MTAFRTLECLAAGNPWLVFFASQLPNLPAASIKRIAEMLLAAINTPEDFQRREAVLRAIHWEDRFLYRLPEIAPQIINATRPPPKKLFAFGYGVTVSQPYVPRSPLAISQGLDVPQASRPNIVSVLRLLVPNLGFFRLSSPQRTTARFSRNL